MASNPEQCKKEVKKMAFILAYGGQVDGMLIDDPHLRVIQHHILSQQHRIVALATALISKSADDEQAGNG